MEYLQLAAEESEDGETFELIGSLYFEDEAWESAYTAFMQAKAAVACIWSGVLMTTPSRFW